MTGSNPMSIAIDGPAGAGKSTVSKLVALRLGLQYVDTGAMYRGVALAALRRGVSPDDEPQLTAIADNLEFSFKVERPSENDLVIRVFTDGEEVTKEIRAPECGNMASKVSSVSGVRRALVAQQKHMGAAGGVVMEGRDIGSVVMPGAPVKIFLTASAEERARRRTLELEQKGTPQSFEQVLAEIRERDHRDSTRADSPLKPAPDSVTVTTDGMSIPQVVEEIVRIAESKIAP
jgi:cytidylate kinase